MMSGEFDAAKIKDDEPAAHWTDVRAQLPAEFPLSDGRNARLIFCGGELSPEDPRIRTLISSGVPCLPVLSDGTSVFIGPLYDEETGVMPIDHEVRLRAARRNSQIREPTRDRAPGDPVFGQLEIRLIISAVRMIMDGLCKLPGRFVGREFELDLLALAVRIHPMLPLPNRVVAAYAGEHSWDDLVDERSGIITHLATAHHSGMISATARIADLSVFEPLWVDDRQGFGMSTRAGKHVEAAAVSEILEAYGGFLWESTAERLEKHNGVVSVMGKDFVSGKARYVAASQIYLNWYRREGVMPSASTSTNISGIAAGSSLDFAVVSALQELIERDAMTVWWLNGPVLPRRVASRECLIRLGLLGRAGVALHFIDLPSPTGVPTVVAILAGMTPNPVLGFATRHTSELAEEKAALEALLLVRTVTGLDDPESELWAAIIEGRVDRGALREWRQDRAYAMDFGGPHNVSDLLSQLQYIFTLTLPLNTGTSFPAR